ncbi:MAG: hypothetical protein GWO16_02780, partial [Gammaproteobacteria bacterium]|nr:hypothetical protein [Gammaproteobacteria bacterium]NIR97058.1 hypothetical protein [Gammaproteobacteria bacterium]NIT62756.1 hypothetical protein [Gammaproteobacteria bacterium]NIV19715.1 hypothetical protein [Gammaproteobacteria bacterium]NIY31336.1 hypothetical protein [Gammaproteobacteria bacterium]
LWLAGCLWAGGLLHIVGDLFTPGWQMPVFWPLDGTYGALRHIGWFSPYLSWLFVSAIALGWLATFLPLQGRLGGLSPGAVSWGVFALAAYRWLDFLLTSRYESWAQWHAFHRALLPEAMIAPLVQGVSSLWHWFTG